MTLENDRHSRELYGLHEDSRETERQLVTLYKGMAAYGGGDLLPPVARGSTLRPKKDPEVVIRNMVGYGRTPEDIAREHATMSTGWSPGVSFTEDFRVAAEFARRLAEEKGTPGVVLEVELPKEKAFSIVELSRQGKAPENLPAEQIEEEKEWVYLGTVPAEMVKKVHVIRPEKPH